MSRHDHLRRLNEIVKVRGVQTQAAELRVQMASAAVRDLGRQKQAKLSDVAAAQEGWERSISDLTLGLQMAPFWSSEIARRNAELRDLDTSLVTARQTQVQEAEAWRAALSRQDAAAELAHEAQRRLLSRKSEAALNEIADRFAAARASA